MRTVEPGVLTVMSAYPDPPFGVVRDGLATGFDIELMRAVCVELGLRLRPIAYQGDNFNGIFDELAAGQCDAVISGTTITSARAERVLFSQPYLEFDQGVAVNRRLTPLVASVADLHGLTAGIQSGNTSDSVAKQLRAEGQIAGIRYYPYHGIGAALDDLEAGEIGLMITLYPVISSLVRGRPDLAVVTQVPTREQLAIAYAKDRSDLCRAVGTAIAELRADGRFARLQAEWFGNGAKR